MCTSRLKWELNEQREREKEIIQILKSRKSEMLVRIQGVIRAFHAFILFPSKRSPFSAPFWFCATLVLCMDFRISCQILPFSFHIGDWLCARVFSFLCQNLSDDGLGECHVTKHSRFFNSSSPLMALKIISIFKGDNRLFYCNTVMLKILCLQIPLAASYR